MVSSVAVIDYGMGNLHSIAKALQHVASDCIVEVTSDAERIINADRVVFPGVGAMPDCMAVLRAQGLDRLVLQLVREKKPLLGICLGMQALLDHSDEGEGTDCLAIIPGKVVRFSEGLKDHAGMPLKIPHMGWNQVHHRNNHPLWHGIEQDSRFYFVHSHYAKPDKAENVAATCAYPDDFACAVQLDNLFAVQFHPEKSQHQGLKLLENFLRWDGVI